MQARLEIKRFPTTLIAILFALALTLVMGGALGYVLKPATVVPGPTHVIVVPAGQATGSNASDDPCWLINRNKAC